MARTRGALIAAHEHMSTAQTARSTAGSSAHDDSGPDNAASLAGWLVAAAAMLSGPIGFAIASARPQPAWTDAATYAAHAHPLQQVPFWAGFALVGASVLLIARLASLGFEHHRTRALGAVAAVGVYAAIITVNYALQVAYVPAAARADDPALAYVTMTNPNAPAWVLEMFGYAILGVATFLAAPLVRGAGVRRRWIRGLLRANGVISAGGAVATAVKLSWVQSLAGLASFLGWNVLLAATAVLIGLEYAPRPGRAGDGNAQELRAAAGAASALRRSAERTR